MFDPATYLTAALAVVLAGISKGGFGSGASFAGAVLLALVMEPAQALAVMLPLLMVMDVTALPTYWGRWDGGAARALALGAVPGVMLGALVLGRADPDLLRLLIGGVALGFVAFQIVRGAGWLRLSGLPAGPVAGLGWGAMAGFTSFVSHAGGPPAAVYLLSRGVSKEAYQATTVVVFWIVNLLKIGPYVWFGAIGQETLLLDAALVPLAVGGIFAGIWLHRRIPAAAYFAVTYALLTVTGGKLIWDALG